MEKEMKTQNKISGHIIRSAAYAVFLSVTFIAASSASNSPNTWQRSAETTGNGIRVIESNEDILLSDTEDIPMRRASIGAPIFRIW